MLRAAQQCYRAQAKAVESSLWIKVFYNVIAEFRKRIGAAREDKPGDTRGSELKRKARSPPY